MSRPPSVDLVFYRDVLAEGNTQKDTLRYAQVRYHPFMEDDLTLLTAPEVADVLRLNHQVVQRKLQAGEIPAYRIGREWRVKKIDLIEWLEQHSNRRLPKTTRQRTLASFFGPDGRLTKIPDRRGKREEVLREVVKVLEPARIYAERDLNAVLRRFHDDVAWLRRELVSMKLLVRTRNGIYKRTGTD
jgi:excisionase family DNA binding protein